MVESTRDKGSGNYFWISDEDQKKFATIIEELDEYENIEIRFLSPPHHASLAEKLAPLEPILRILGGRFL